MKASLPRKSTQSARFVTKRTTRRTVLEKRRSTPRTQKSQIVYPQI